MPGLARALDEIGRHEHNNRRPHNHSDLAGHNRSCPRPYLALPQPLDTTGTSFDLCGVSRENFNICISQAVQQAVRGVNITADIPWPGELRFDNVPPACIDLVVITNNVCKNEGPRLQTCGSACAHYTDLSPEQLDLILSSASQLADIPTK
ncbi:hypothetical protein V8F20_001600 [Naviculisporaceae sp. PSN 640]